MDCRIVFYSARKTSLCERALKKYLAPLGIIPGEARFATRADALGLLITDTFASGDMAAVIGGLEFGDERSIVDIMSSALGKSRLDLVRRLENADGDDGYLIRSGDQLLLLLPDEPEQIGKMTEGALGEYLRSLSAGK